MMKKYYFKTAIKYIFLLFIFTALSANAQLSILTNLTTNTTDICQGSFKKLVVSVSRGNCTVFSGNVNAASFVWQIETSPGVWVSIDSYSVPGVTYGVEQRINSGGTVISNILTVSSTNSTPEVTLKYRVLASGMGGCATVTSNYESIAFKYNRWLGLVDSSWTNPSNWSCGGVPPSTSVVVVPSASISPVISSNVIVKEIIVQSGGNLTVASEYNMTVNGPVTVQGTGVFALQNNANLLQSSYTGSNSGTVKVARNSSALMRLDYTLWSSPVASQNLLSFSPQTLTNRFYEYKTDTNTFSSVVPSTNVFQLGKGYLIRMPDSHPTTATIWNGLFSGVPNNGDVSLVLNNGGVGKRFNAIGNPYPSPVRMSSFVVSNSNTITGTLYFWRKSNSTTTNPGYCTWTSAGFVSNGEAQVIDPKGILNTGQGFLVEMKNSETTVVFNNAMRTINNDNQFFKTNEEALADDGIIKGDKIKLNISNSQGFKNQMLLGYFNQGTDGIDFSLDGKVLEDYPLALTMRIEDNDYSIQGKGAFVETDVTPFTFKTETAGEFTISINELSGVFAANQEVFLKDKALNKIHDLKANEYRFVSEPGVFESRFEILYKKDKLIGTLNTDDEVIVYKENNQMEVSSTKEISKVQVYDSRGRLLKEVMDVSNTKCHLDLNFNNEVLIVKVIDTTGNYVNKKIIY